MIEHLLHHTSYMKSFIEGAVEGHIGRGRQRIEYIKYHGRHE